MSIISKYIIREVTRHFALILLAVIGIYISVDFFEKIDNFMESGVALTRMIPFFLYKIPFIVVQILPVGVLLSVLVVLGVMKRNNELMALKAGGISMFKIVRIVAAVGLVASMLLFFLSEVVVPLSIRKSNQIWMGEVRKKFPLKSERKNIWIKENRRIIHIVYFNPVKNSIHGITVNYFDKNFKLVRRLDAKSGIFRQGHWVLQDVMTQHLNPATGSYDITSRVRAAKKFDFKPRDLRRMTRRAAEMGFWELWRYVKKIEAEGYDSTKLRVDLQAKVAFPLVCVVLCILGAGLSLEQKKTEGIAVMIAYGLAASFLYWVFYSFCVSLGYGEMLPPAVAVWLANVIFLCMGVFILLKAE